MSEISAAELQQLRQAAAQGKAQVLISRQRAATDAHYYRAQAEHFKALAGHAVLHSSGQPFADRQYL